MASLKEKLAKIGLKPVDDNNFDTFIIRLMQGKEGNKADYTQKVKKAKTDINPPSDWNLVNLDFDPNKM